MLQKKGIFFTLLLEMGFNDTGNATHVVNIENNYE
jgi:hypothetical protein